MKLNVEQVVRSIRSTGRKNWIRSLIYSILVSLLLLTALNFTAKGMRRFGPQETPIIFWFVALIMGLAPMVYFKLYRVFTRPSFAGTVIKSKNKSTIVPRTDINTGYLGSRNDFVKSEVCILSIRPDRGIPIPRKFIFALGNQSEYAWAHLPVGARARFVFGARLPFSEDSIGDRPFCPRCGQFGSPNEEECACGGVFLKRIEE